MTLAFIPGFLFDVLSASSASPAASMGAALSPPKPQPPPEPILRLGEVSAERSSAGHAMCVTAPAFAPDEMRLAAVTAWSVLGRRM